MIANEPFHGKVAAITGGTSGIGQALVNTFLQAGAKVATCARGKDSTASLALVHPEVLWTHATGVVGLEMASRARSPRSAIRKCTPKSWWIQQGALNHHHYAERHCRFDCRLHRPA